MFFFAYIIFNNYKNYKKRNIYQKFIKFLQNFKIKYKYKIMKLLNFVKYKIFYQLIFTNISNFL